MLVGPPTRAGVLGLDEVSVPRRHVQEQALLMRWEVVAGPNDLDTLEGFAVLDGSFEVGQSRLSFGVPEECHIVWTA